MKLLLVCLIFAVARANELLGEFRRTPFGVVHQDCLIEIPSGTEIEETIVDGVPHAHVVYPDGNTKLHPQCPYSTTLREKFDYGPPVWNGWPRHYWYGTDYAYFTHPALTSPVTYFQAQWNVPNYPIIRYGNSSAPWPNQPSLSWWIGIQPSIPMDVLQPVLEFNGLIPNQYDISSWNCCPAGYTFYSTPLLVYPGQVIQGVIELLSPYSYIIETEVLKGASTNLTVNLSAHKPTFTWAEVKHEGYFITNCNQLPSNNATFVINELDTQQGSVDVNSIPWKMGYQCEGSACPSQALSPTCIFNTSISCDIITIQV